MKQNHATIIFCHYGNSPYLEFTLRTVKATNPNARIVLLGDEKNMQIAKIAQVEFRNFANFSNSIETNEFDKVYKHIAGKNHGREFWTNFVFKRWFYVHEFVRTEKINSFWHFDSDNLILTDLKNQEIKFLNYDCTEQCEGICMNGFISNFNVVDGYIKKINELFQNESYLQTQLQEFEKFPEWAFTEMRAFNTYKNDEKIKTIRLNTIINNETFDDCICNKDNFITYNRPINSYNIKKLFYKDGSIFCFHENLQTHIKMNSLNMSWVPNYFFENIYILITSKKYKQKNSYQEIDIFKKINKKNLITKLLNYFK